VYIIDYNKLLGVYNWLWYICKYCYRQKKMYLMKFGGSLNNKIDNIIKNIVINCFVNLGKKN